MKNQTKTSTAPRTRDNNKIKGSRAFMLAGENLWRIRKPRPIPAVKDKYIKFRYADNFIEEMPIPMDGESIYALVSGSFIYGDIMLPIAEKIGGHARLDICTLSMGQENIDMIAEMFELNLITEFNLIISDFFYAHEKKHGGLWNYLFENLAKYNIRVSVASVHTKIIMLKNPYFDLVLSGSANLRSSANMEQFELQNDNEFWEWQKEWQEQIHEKYNVIKKPIRSRNVAEIFGAKGTRKNGKQLDRTI